MCVLSYFDKTAAIEGSYFGGIQQFFYLFLSFSVIFLQAAYFGFHLLVVRLLCMETLQRNSTNDESHIKKGIKEDIKSAYVSPERQTLYKKFSYA